MENNTFRYSYSAKRNMEVESIRRKYMPHKESKLETLKRLDRRARRAGSIESLCLGIVGVLVFGIGICFLLGVFAGTAWLKALFLILGTVMMLPAYPMYRRISYKAREKYAPEILRLSEEIMNS